MTPNLSDKEAELADRAARFVRTEMQRHGVTYAQMADYFRRHGVQETDASISRKLAKPAFAAVFFLAVRVALDREAGQTP